jgi:hypothetical protein
MKTMSPKPPVTSKQPEVKAEPKAQPSAAASPRTMMGNPAPVPAVKRRVQPSMGSSMAKTPARPVAAAPSRRMRLT